MPLPQPNLAPAFNLTRASHCVLTSRDLQASREFYEKCLGFEVTHHDGDVLMMRGMEEAAHHSLVFHATHKDAKALRVGYRMRTNADLDRAADWFAENGQDPQFVERPFQGKTLHVADAVGTPLEFCATMDQIPHRIQDYHLHHGATPMRLDHYQISTHAVEAATRFYMDMGFRMTEYTGPRGSDELWGTWLTRKDNTQDVVFTNGKGPRLHHFAYTVPEIANVVHACDVAYSMGYAPRIDRGPGRHGMANAFFVYFLDPDGHRIELFTDHYQTIDIDWVPKRWDLTDTSRSQLWGLPARRAWFMNASEFESVELREPLLKADPVTLETFLGMTN